MASKIRVLSDHTINKIAAGEVIENPASVVKELVENSIDAGSKSICIEIKGGGRQLIRISDDGCGMNADDAILCLERHATSKIREVEEIQDVSTLGFRGEAIPSIASISKFTLLTCPEEKKDSMGTMVIVEGGKLISCSPAACSKGTTIEVKSLFFNVPVRKKFMKSPAYDSNEIAKSVSLIALGYPHIKFQLVNDGKSILTTPSKTKTDFIDLLKERISIFLGDEFLENTTEISCQDEGITLRGVVGVPNYTRHNRSGQYLYINQRAVFSPAISHAVKEGYGTALASGRHPVFVLHLTLPGELVDVNVHPQKKEVRLRQEPIIRNLIIKAIGSTLKTSTHLFDTPILHTHFPATPLVSTNCVQDVKVNIEKKADAWTFQPKNIHQPPPPHLPLPPSWLQGPTTPPPIKLGLPDINVDQQNTSHSSVSFIPALMPKKTSPKVLATLQRYILIDGSNLHALEINQPHQSKGGLALVDQKAAHGRILFEKLQQQKSGETLPQQILLIPHTVEVSPFEAEAIRAALPAINRLGIHMHEFGPRSFKVDAIPQAFGNTNLEMLIHDIISEVRGAYSNDIDMQIFEQERVKQIALSASRAAVSNDRRLSLEEAQSLLDQLMYCQNPLQCPSGKPTMIHLSSDELAKMFQK